MKISTTDVHTIARLARLQVTDAEVDALADELGSILDYVDRLAELDTSGIPPTTHALEQTNTLRDDIVQPSLSQAEALANAPSDNGEAFVVPRVI